MVFIEKIRFTNDHCVSTRKSQVVRVTVISQIEIVCVSGPFGSYSIDLLHERCDTCGRNCKTENAIF
jgi:hypothetical protein